MALLVLFLLMYRLFCFFAPQIKMKFGREDGTYDPLLLAKFHLDQLRGVSLWPLNLENYEFYRYNCPKINSVY